MIAAVINAMLAASVLAFAAGLRCGIAWERNSREWARKHKCRSRDPSGIFTESGKERILCGLQDAAGN